MVFKNSEIQEIVVALHNIGNRATIKDKWEMAKYSKPFFEASQLIQNQVNEIIRNEGNEDGTLSTSNKHYLELMNLDIDVDVEKLSLSTLEKYNPTINEMIVLESIILEE